MQDLHLILVFIAIVVVGLGIDLFVVGKNSHAVSNREAITWTLIWVGLSVAFAGFIHWDQGGTKATEFLTAYMIEKALSVDNLFVFILVFNYFNVPEQYKHKVLFWGIIGAIGLRAVFIFTGVGLINLTYIHIGKYEVSILLLCFGLFLVYAGIKSGIEVIKGGDEEEEEDFASSPGAKLVKWIFGNKVAGDYDGDKFFTTKTELVQLGDTKVGMPQPMQNVVVRYITPLLIVVGVIEFTDLLFAVDSIPAIFSVSKDPFILYSSNIFAILGLRCMYFLLNNFIKFFRFLPYGLAIILTFIGVKMVIAPIPALHIESTASLVVVGGILLLSTLASVVIKEKPEEV